MQIARAGRSQVGNGSPALIRPREPSRAQPTWVNQTPHSGNQDRDCAGKPLRHPPPSTPRLEQRKRAGLVGGRGPGPGALGATRGLGSSSLSRSKRVKMRTLIVTKRRRLPARSLPKAVREALAAARRLRWPHLWRVSGCGGEAG